MAQQDPQTDRERARQRNGLALSTTNKRNKTQKDSGTLRMDPWHQRSEQSSLLQRVHTMRVHVVLVPWCIHIGSGMINQSAIGGMDKSLTASCQQDFGSIVDSGRRW